VDGTVGVYDEITGKVAERFSNVIADPVGTLLDGVESKMVTGVQNRGMDELGLIYRQPSAQVDNRTFNANVPEFSVAPVNQYSGEAIMSANAFETNVTHSSSPYGFTAMLYGDYQKNFVKP
jgi:enoyl reductase-like protein